MNQDSLISIKNVSFSYRSKQIYNDLSLEIPRGKITAILGPSGTGKTTILRMIGAQLTPDSGTILFDGINVHKLSRNELYKLRERMSMLFQSGALFTDMTVYDNVAYPIREHTSLPEELVKDIVMMNLEAVGMRAAASLYPSELSGGMARRAALARSIALDPDLIMYDEPFVGQDPITKGVLVKLISDINKSLGKTSVVVTHDVKEILEVAHYVYIVAQGSVLGCGTPDEIRSSSDPRVIQFINGDFDGPYAFKLKGSQNYIEDL
ncbi:MAG: ATP-binding cassette domain-containing protein [Succinivibrio sp.]